MMYLCTPQGEIIWRVGHKMTFDTSSISEVQADGHELEWIRENFSNLPMFKGRVCNWFGDMAKMIAAAVPRED